MPRGDALAERLASVLEVVYLVFNEGYSATRGDDWMRPALCDEALRLGRMLAELAPQQAEVHGLVALMEIQASRTAARTDAEGRPVLLAAQDRSRWDPPADPPRPGRAGARRGAGPARRALPTAGRHRRLPRPRRAAPKTPTGPASARCMPR